MVTLTNEDSDKLALVRLAFEKLHPSNLQDCKMASFRLPLEKLMWSNLQPRKFAPSIAVVLVKSIEIPTVCALYQSSIT